MSLKIKAIKGTRWTVVESFSTIVIQILQVAILSRFLTPTDFGLMAIVLISLSIGQVIGNLGLSQSIVQAKTITKTELSTLYWINIGCSLAIYLVIYLITPIISLALDEEVLGLLIRVALFGIVLNALSSQFEAIAQRGLDFLFLAISRIIASIFGLVIAVSAAVLFDAGVWSLIYGQLSSMALRSLILFGYAYKKDVFPKFYVNVKDCAERLHFGIYLLGDSLLILFNTKLDQMLIGIMLGAEVLGYYSIATNLVVQPIAKLNPMLVKVAFTIFSKVQGDEGRLKYGYKKMLSVLATINAPLVLGIGATAPLLVPILLGDGWLPVVPLLQILSFYALIRSFGSAGSSILLASGKSKWSFYWHLGLLPVFILVIVGACSSYDLVIVAASLVILSIFIITVHYWLLVRPLIDGTINDLISPLIKPVAFGCIMYVVVSSVVYKTLLFSIFVQFILAIFVGAFIYISLFLLFSRAECKEYMTMLMGDYSQSKKM